MTRAYALVIIAGSLLRGFECFVAPRPSGNVRQRKPNLTSNLRASMLLPVEHGYTLLVIAGSASSISDIVDQTPGVVGAAADFLGSTTDVAGSSADFTLSTKASIVDPLRDIGDIWDSIVDSLASIKVQVGQMRSSAILPFQELGESFSGAITRGFANVAQGAHKAAEDMQAQMGQSLTDTVGDPVRKIAEDVLSRFGTSPEELLKEERTLTGGLGEAVQSVEKVATPSTLFYIENAAILPLWAAMIVWPEKPLTRAIMSSYAPIVVAALIYLWLTYECFQNPVALQGFASGITNLPGLTKGFQEEVSVATAWSHFLAEDLFIGRWVYLDGQRNGVFTKHSIALSYLFGPGGFLSHLVTRAVYGIIKPSIRDIMEPAPAASTRLRSDAQPSANPEKIVEEARREADAILSRARSEGVAQAASLLEAAETEALDILKGAEVERTALLKARKEEQVAQPEQRSQGGPLNSARVDKIDVAAAPEVGGSVTSNSQPVSPMSERAKST